MGVTLGPGGHAASAVQPFIASLRAGTRGYAAGMVAGTARAWFAASPRRLEVVGGAGGLVMIGIGASLALTGRSD